MPTLYELSMQNLWPRFRENFVTEVFAFEDRIEAARENCDDTPSRYDFETLLWNALAPLLGHTSRDRIPEDLVATLLLLDYGQRRKVTSYSVGTLSSSTLQGNERFAQFVEWLHGVHPLAARELLAKHCVHLQVRMFAEAYPMDLLHKMLAWDRLYPGILLRNPRDSFAHFIMTQEFARHFTTQDELARLRAVVASGGEVYLRYIPSSDIHARHTLVAAALWFGNVDGSDDGTHALFEFLITACPAALRVPSVNVHRSWHNAFTAVGRRCKNPRNERTGGSSTRSCATPSSPTSPPWCQTPAAGPSCSTCGTARACSCSRTSPRASRSERPAFAHTQ